jgi:HEAT repeat protein
VRAAACAYVLPRLGAAGAGTLLDALADPSPAVRHASVRLLGSPRTDLGEREGDRRQALLQARRDPSSRVSAAAAKALARIDAGAPAGKGDAA